METWRQRTRLLVDEIHKVDPYYSFPGELTPRVTGLASYADIAAGRSTPNSRDTSPYRVQQESGSSQTAPQHQIHRPQVIRPQSAQVSQIPQPQIPQTPQVPQINEPEKENIERESKKASKRRGRSPTRSNRKKIVDVPEIKVTGKEAAVQERVSFETKEHISTSLAAHDPRRRSPSPIWIPGSTSYADILRKAQGPGSYTTESPEHDYGMIMLTKERRESIGSSEKSVSEEIHQIEKSAIRDVTTPGDKYQVTNQDSQNLSKERWSENTLNQGSMMENKFEMPVSQPEVYEYNAPMTDVVDIGTGVNFFNTGLDYPVGSYVYPAASHQQQLQAIYDTHMRYTAQFITQQDYLTTESQDAYLQMCGIQNQQCPQSEMIYDNSVILGDAMPRQVCQSQVQDHVSVVDSSVSLPENNKTIEVNESVEVKEGDSEPKEKMGDEDVGEVEQVQTEVRASSISYAKILSQGLPARTTPSPPTNKFIEESSQQSLQTAHEIIKPDARIVKKDVDSEPDVDSGKKNKDGRNWGTIKKKDSRRKGQEDKKVEGVKENSRDKKQKKQFEAMGKSENIGKNIQEKISETSKIVEIIVNEKNYDNVKEVVDKMQKDDNLNDNIEKDKKRKHKKKKSDKSREDEIDKALKEIADMEKQKVKDKVKEKEQKPKESESKIEEIQKIDKVKKIKGKGDKDIGEEQAKEVSKVGDEVKFEESKKSKSKKNKEAKSHEKAGEEIRKDSKEKLDIKTLGEEVKIETIKVEEVKNGIKDDKVFEEKNVKGNKEKKQKKKKDDKLAKEEAIVESREEIKDEDMKDLSGKEGDKVENKNLEEKVVQSTVEGKQKKKKGDKAQPKIDKADLKDKSVAEEIKQEEIKVGDKMDTKIPDEKSHEAPSKQKKKKGDKSQAKIEKSDSKDSDKKLVVETKKEELKDDKEKIDSKESNEKIKQEENMQNSSNKTEIAKEEVTVLEEKVVQTAIETKQNKKKGNKSHPKIEKYSKDTDIKSLPVETKQGKIKDDKEDIKMEEQKSTESTSKPMPVETKSEEKVKNQKAQVDKQKSVESTDKPIPVDKKVKDEKLEVKVEKQKSGESMDKSPPVETKQDKVKNEKQSVESATKSMPVEIKDDTVKDDKLQVKVGKQKSVESIDKPIPVDKKLENEKGQVKVEKQKSVEAAGILTSETKEKIKGTKALSKIEKSDSKDSDIKSLPVETTQEKVKDDKVEMKINKQKSTESTDKPMPVEIKQEEKVKDDKAQSKVEKLETKSSDETLVPVTPELKQKKKKGDKQSKADKVEPKSPEEKSVIVTPAKTKEEDKKDNDPQTKTKIDPKGLENKILTVETKQEKTKNTKPENKADKLEPKGSEDKSLPVETKPEIKDSKSQTQIAKLKTKVSEEKTEPLIQELKPKDVNQQSKVEKIEKPETKVFDEKTQVTESSKKSKQKKRTKDNLETANATLKSPDSEKSIQSPVEEKIHEPVVKSESKVSEETKPTEKVQQPETKKDIKQKQINKSDLSVSVSKSEPPPKESKENIPVKQPSESPKDIKEKPEPSVPVSKSEPLPKENIPVKQISESPKAIKGKQTEKPESNVSVSKSEPLPKESKDNISVKQTSKSPKEIEENVSIKQTLESPQDIKGKQTEKSEPSVSVSKSEPSPKETKENVSVQQAPESPKNIKENVSIKQKSELPQDIKGKQTEKPEPSISVSKSEPSPKETKENVSVQQAPESPKNIKENVSIKQTSELPQDIKGKQTEKPEPSISVSKSEPSPKGTKENVSVQQAPESPKNIKEKPEPSVSVSKPELSKEIKENIPAKQTPASPKNIKDSSVKKASESSPKVTRPKETKLKNKSKSQPQEQVIVEKIAPTYVVESKEIKKSTDIISSDRKTNVDPLKETRIRGGETKHSNGQAGSKSQEVKRNTRVKSEESVSKTESTISQIDESQSQSALSEDLGKALIIEKTITTVTTTRTGTEVLPPTVKSEKSVEILENVPLPISTGSKTQEIISLCPDIVEANLTTTYAVTNNPVTVPKVEVSQPVAQLDDKEDVNVDNKEKSIGSLFLNTINLNAGDDDAPLFGSVQNRKSIRSKADSTSSYESSHQHDVIKPTSEETQKVEREMKEQKVVRDEKLKTDDDEQLKCIADDFKHPYWADYDSYRNAEKNLYQNFKVVRVMEPQTLSSSMPKSSSLERIAQEAFMDHARTDAAKKSKQAKNVKGENKSQATELSRLEIQSAESEAVKVKEKSQVKKENERKAEEIKDSNKTLEASNVITDVKKESVKEEPKIHLVADDSWMDILDEPMVIDDDFDDEIPDSKIVEKSFEKIQESVGISSQVTEVIEKSVEFSESKETQPSTPTSTEMSRKKSKKQKKKDNALKQKEGENEKISGKKDAIVEKENLHPLEKSFAKVAAKSLTPSPDTAEEINKPEGIVKPEAIKQKLTEQSADGTKDTQANKKSKDRVKELDDKNKSSAKANVSATEKSADVTESDSWAAIAAKNVEVPENVKPVAVKSSEKIEQPKSQVQIVVEEVIAPEPIENLVQVDDQGFMEYVNRKELRSRRSRSRSRSRSQRRDNTALVIEGSADVGRKLAEGTQECISLIDTTVSGGESTEISKEESKSKAEVVESEQAFKGKSKQKKKQKEKELKAEVGKVQVDGDTKTDEKSEVQKVEDKKPEPQNKKGDKQSKKSKDQAKKMKEKPEVKKSEEKKVEVKTEVYETKKLEEPEKCKDEKQVGESEENVKVDVTEAEKPEKLEPKDQLKKPEEKAPKEQPKKAEVKKPEATKKSGKKEPKKAEEKKIEEIKSEEQKSKTEVKKSADKKPEQPKQSEEQVKKSKDKPEAQANKSEVKKPESPEKSEEKSKDVKKPEDKKEVVAEIVTPQEKIEDNKKVAEVAVSTKPKDKKKNKKTEKIPAEVSKKSVEKVKEPEILKKVEELLPQPPKSEVEKLDLPDQAQDQSLASEDSKDSGFFVITSESQVISESCHESSLPRDMVVVPPMESASLPLAAEAETRPLSRSPLPKTKATSNLLSKNSSSTSLEHSSIEICETPSSKVQFYIEEDDDIVVISHATDEETCPSQPQSEPHHAAPSPAEIYKFISYDRFWLDKRAYHDAERDFFAERSSKLKQKVSTIKNYYDPRDDNDKNDNDKSGKGPKGPSFDAHSGSSTPKTERLIADLPGGICSWNDYSTYLSLGQDKSRVDPRDQTQTQTSEKLPVTPNYNSSVYSELITLPSLATFSSSSTFIHSISDLSSSQASPPSIQHLGTDKRGSNNQLSSTNDQDLPETSIAVNNDPVNGYKESLESNLENLEAIVSRLEESLNDLPRDSLENMLSALAVILGDLRKHDQRSNDIQKQLEKIEAVEGEKLVTPLEKIRGRIAALTDQVEQGIAALGKAREVKHQREQQVLLYKNFLEETDTWLRNLVLMISQQQSIDSYKTLLDELEARNQRMNELETLTEVSELARSLKAALLETHARLKQKQQEIEEEESAQASEEMADHDDITLDQAPSIHSADEGTMSWADVSLQTGQSLMIDNEHKPIQLTKQTSTSQITEFDVQPLEMQSIPVQVSIDEGVKSTQESIKIYKTADDTHEVIEIATKNIPSSHSTSQFIPQDHSADDIVVDMKYQDAKAEQSATSELSIQHAAPQTFETVLTEPDDVTTEVVVDADGTKRIIVRKLRRTLVTSQSTQQHITSMSSVSGDVPSVQAFSEATMRSQQVTVTRTRPDGSVEMAAKQTYGGKITTGGAPGEVVSVEQFETTPQFTHRIIQGELEDIQPESLGIAPDGSNVTIEEGAYQTKTSTVHAMVQQVTRRVIRKTRRTIRKVTIIDGKETMSEEVVEEPEEVEIDEQDIPHISINVVKQEEQKSFSKDSKSVIQVSKATEIDTDTQGPFFGPKARELTPDSVEIMEDRPKIEEIIEKDEEKVVSDSPIIVDSPEKVEQMKVNEITSIQLSQNLIDAEKREIFQSNFEIPAADGGDNEDKKSEVAELPITDAPVDGEPVTNENACKSVDVLPAIMKESFNMKLDAGTVEVVQHADDSSTVEPTGKMSIITLESQQQQQQQQQSSVPSVDQTSPELGESPAELLTPRPSDDSSRRSRKSEDKIDGTVLKDSKAVIDKVEISLLINESQDEAGAFVAVKTTAERPDDVYRVIEENVDIRLPTQVETVKIIPDKIIQTSGLESFEREVSQAPENEPTEKSDAETTSSRKSRKKKRRKDEDTGGKSVSEESGSSIATTIAESVDLNLPMSESPKQISEQPQPDVLEITETSLTLSSPRETSAGYEPEGGTTVEEGSIALDRDELTKKKKKKKKKQKINFEDDKSEERDTRASGIEVSEPVQGDIKEFGEKKFTEIDTQTVYETRDVSASPAELQSLRDSSLQTSPELQPQSQPQLQLQSNVSVDLIEQEIQTEHETINTEIQTSPTQVLDTEIQTSEIESPEKEHLSVQTETPEVSKEEEGVQTSPIESEKLVVTSPAPAEVRVKETEEIDVQTVEVETSEVQTSPIESAVTTEIDTQTDQVEVQAEKVDTELPRVAETQDVELQTSPSQSQEVILEELSVQTSPEVREIEAVEIDVQTSKPASPVERVPVATGDFEVQTNLIEQVTVAAMETQTTPQETPRVETEVQTTPEFTVESVAQTSPEPEHEHKHEEETSLEDKITVEEESQTITPDKIETSDTFVQIQSQELIPTAEEGIQSIPDAAEISLQTLETAEQDTEPAVVVSVAQQASVSSAEVATMPETHMPVTQETATSPIQEFIKVERLGPLVVEEKITKASPDTNESMQLVEKKEMIEEEKVERERIETPDKELTSDGSSFEIHVQATIDLSDNTITEPTIQESESTDITHDTTISEDFSELTDPTIDKTRKRPKKKNKRKAVKPTDEISSTNEKDIQRFESIVSQSGESKDSVVKLSYSDVARKGSKEREIGVDDQNNLTVGKIYTDLDIKKVEHQQRRDSDAQEIKLKATLEGAQSRESFKVKETLVGTSSKGDEFAVSMQVHKSIARRRDRPSIKIETPEPMDTDEEVLSPMESVLAAKNKLPEVKSYAEAIAEPGFGAPSSRSPSTSRRSQSEQFIAAERHDQRPQVLKRTQTAKIVIDRLKNLQNVNETCYLSNILHIASLEDFSKPMNVEERVLNIQKNLSHLKNAVEEQNIVIVDETLITIVEMISTWLETIEYRVFVSREPTRGPSHEDTRVYVELKDEVNHVEDNIKELRRTWKQVESAYPTEDREKVNECMDSLVDQVKAIGDVTRDEERHVTAELSKWDEFLKGVENMYRLVQEQLSQLSTIIESEESTVRKLEELDKLENTNRSHMCNTNKLIAAVRDLLKSYPGRSVPDETYQAHELTLTIEHNINVERERLLQLMSLAEEYEQTLQEFAQITDVAEDLLASPISVISLEHLQEEMQKHRKFFVNLNHCRAILESLENNLDSETRTKHAEFHEELHSRAGSLLDQAASRAQQMSLAASRWMLLEQGFKEERGWLQIAHQRIPDLQTVTSSDYDQYISLYQSLSSDIAMHQARLVQLFDLVHSLQELLDIEDLEERYRESLDVISQLQENVDSSLRCLLTFRDSWGTHEVLTNRLENWMATAERELDALNNNWDGHMRQFWEIKAQYEVHNNLRNEATNCFEQGLRVIPLSDEMIQRQFHGEFQDRWHRVSTKIKTIQKAVADTISSEDTPINEKLRLLERELNELRTTVEGFHGVLKTEDELVLYVGRLSVLFERVCIIQDELVKLGMLPAAESEQVNILLSFAGRMESQVREELDAAQLVQERLQALQRGLTRVRKAHARQSLILDQCEACEKHGSDVVEGGVKRCSQVADELAILWKDLMGLRQLLHTVPGGMRVSVSPVSIERDISLLQDINTDLESRCTRLLSLLKSRLSLWRRFERQLEMVQQSVQEADHMMKILAIQGSVDYERLLKATEHLEGLNGDLGTREAWVGELRKAAEPLLEVCTEEVSERVNAAVNEAVQAWEDTRSELDALCTKYQHAVRLWEQYRDSSAAVKAWVDTQMGSITNLPPEEALKQVKVCEETLAEHKERLAELRGLVAQIASDVGLDSNGPLHCEVEALGRRLEDVRETLSTLADTADARALNQELTRGDLCQTKNFLDSVQQSLITVGQGESKEQLNLLRNHLLALTRTEPQLQSIKDRALEVTTTETSVVDVLQLWQRVFRETFQQYHRLSARLVRSEDVAAALRLWQEYLSHVQEFLSNDMPGDYNGLSEHRNLCEVHKNLLTDQQHLILSIRAEKGRDLSVAEQFNILTNLHNETLSKIMDRHASVRDRLAAWDKYKMDMSKLLSWLKDIEREKSRLQLRFIHVRRLDKIIAKIESLLEKLPIGETQINSLSVQQESLLVECEEALAVSIRMEHAANTQRITNLRASLETWRDFVLRIRKLNEQHVEQTAVVSKTFQEISKTISAAFHNTSSNLQYVKQQLDSLNQLRAKLNDAPSQLEALGVTTEQLRECLSPSDMKSLNQHNSLLWQQHGDLEHQLALLVYKLGERLSLRGKWDKRLTRFFVWVTDAETRINSCDATTLEEPEEALKRLEGELHAEMALKQRELEWLHSTGQELIDVADAEDKVLIKKSLDDIDERWARLMNAGKARTTKLLDLMQTMNLLEKSIAEIRGWLGKVELQLTEAFIIESKAQSTIDKKLEDHEMLQKTIEAESGKIGEVLNLCEILLNDCDAWKASFNTDPIKTGMKGLEKRWKSTCVRSADRKRKIMMAWKLVQELDKVKQEQEQWIADTETELLALEGGLDKTSKEDSEQMLTKTRRILKDLDAHKPALMILEQSYSRLAKSGLEPENLKTLTSDVRLLLDRWQALKPRAESIISALKREQKAYREFITAHGSAVVGLTQVDVKLTQVQHLEQKVSTRRRQQQIMEIEKELAVQSRTLQRADELALIVMQDCAASDVPAIQELVDEYQLLWQDIKSRVAALKIKFEESNDKMEVDEAVQVETLKFEQDSAVQVDTLPRLTRMTSCDAYLIELQSALTECRNALEELEDAVTPEPVPGPGLASAAKNIAKLIGSCQSAIELAKHLHGLLTQDGKLNDEVAKTVQVNELAGRYESILVRARAREQQIREIRSPLVNAYSLPCEHDQGRLTCPLCSRRNWAQLDIDLWRLEKWLEYAEGIQSEQHSPPSNIEDLEDIIQDHREFLLDLDSHKSIVISLNIVGSHLADHTEDIERAQELRDRLGTANSRWERVCSTARTWQSALQSALMGNQQFHRIVEELLSWLERTENSIQANEPIDLADNVDVIKSKYNKFRELRSDLERCEPRVVSLEESAHHLLDESMEIRGRLHELKLRLQSLRRLTGIYALKLGAALGLDPKEVGLAATSSSLASLSNDLLDGASSTTSLHGQSSSTDGDERDRTVLVRGYRFLGRVLRASLPIQALMLLLLGVASLVPTAEDDYSCMLSNNIARTFNPVVEYPNGPPPL